MRENSSSSKGTLSHMATSEQDSTPSVVPKPAGDTSAAKWLSRRTPLVLLLVMVLVGFVIEAALFPPMKWQVKAPILILLLWGLWAAKAPGD